MTDEPAISIEPFRGTINVMFSDAILASTEDALVLREAGGGPAYFIPREDVYFEFLQPGEPKTEKPPKGRAEHWIASAVGEAADVMWSYPEAYGAYAPLAGYVTFAPDKTRIQVVPRPDPLTDIP